jgi:HEAT repeat protein
MMRLARAVSALAEIGSPEARKALADLAAGPLEADLVRWARDAMER